MDAQNTWRKKLLAYNALEREKNVTVGNDTPAVIKGKGYFFLKEKVKANNFMYVDGLKHNLLSVSQCVIKEMKLSLAQKNVWYVNLTQENGNKRN